jgi:hypothetical protein
MLTKIEDQLNLGALGIGLGLDYLGEAINDHELSLIFDLAAKYQVPLFIHIRPGINGDPSDLDEVLAQAKRSGAPLHICDNTHNAMKLLIYFCLKFDSPVNNELMNLPYNMGLTLITAEVFKQDWQTIPTAMLNGLIRASV